MMLDTQGSRRDSGSKGDCARGMTDITRSSPSFMFVFVKHALVPDEHCMNMNIVGTIDQQ